MEEPRVFEDDDIPPHLLQHELIDLLQLGLQVKQAQWSLRDQSTKLSKSLSGLSVSCLRWADQIAQALAKANVPPDGRASTLAASPNLVSLQPKWREEKEVAELATERCHMFATWAQERADDPYVQGTPNRRLFARIAEGLRGFSPAADPS
jgi:starvation-inducible DNA-binding protein